MTAQQPATYTHNKGSFWLGVLFGLLGVFLVFLFLLILFG